MVAFVMAQYCFLIVSVTLSSACGGTQHDTASKEVGAVISRTPNPIPRVEPKSDYCHVQNNWTDEQKAFEDQLFEIVNRVRQAGTTCGSHGPQQPVEALTTSDIATCAARVHTLDQIERNYSAHESPEGQTPKERVRLAGLEKVTVGENLDAVEAKIEGNIDRDRLPIHSPEQVVDDWLSSPGHCLNLMRASFTQVGYGYMKVDTETGWKLIATQVFIGPSVTVVRSRKKASLPSAELNGGARSLNA